MTAPRTKRWPPIRPTGGAARGLTGSAETKGGVLRRQAGPRARDDLSALWFWQERHHVLDHYQPDHCSRRSSAGNLFELKDLGRKKIKGIEAPVRAWTALRPSSAAGRFEAFHPTGLTALVGREEELEILLRRWSRAKAGAGQVALLSGEAGIGKSRLTVALLEAIASEPHTPPAQFLLTTARRQRALSDHRPDRACRWIYALRYFAGEARQARRTARTKFYVGSRLSTLRGVAVAAK
jgi:hypothetical protein